MIRTLFVALVTRGGVLEDTFWSPWPWLWSLKFSKIALSSARGQHYFWTVEISLENAWNLAENLQRPFFWFPQVEIAWKKILKTFFFEIAWTKILKTFFWEHLRLCPWSLASRGSVLGLGLENFLCPWPWPRALCPRLHLCWLLRAWRNQHLLTNFQWTNVSCDFVEFLSTEFVACLKPHSRDEIGCRLNQDYAIRVVVKTTPLPFRSRCRLLSFSLWFEII